MICLEFRYSDFVFNHFMSQRIDQVNEMLMRSISQIIQRELELDKAIVTVSKVSTSPDLSRATVFVTIMPESKRGSALTILKKNKVHLQKELGSSIHLRKTPKLQFKIDNQAEKAQKLEALLDQIKAKNETSA